MLRVRSEPSRFSISITLLLLAVFVLVPTLAVAQSKNKNALPNLPETPYNYAIDRLPKHLISIPTIVVPDHSTPNHLATLGRVLFYDKSLSRNHLVSCASCHQQQLGFDDHSRFSIGFKGIITNRSAMGLTNARFNTNGHFFWDERAASLNEQVLMPFFDPIEMGMTPDQLKARIGKLSYYQPLFSNAFSDPAITQENISFALVQFLQAMVSSDALYDRARINALSPLQDFTLFSPLQNRGKHLFFNPVESGGAGCIACHQTEAFIALPGGANNGLDARTKDQGIGEITGKTNDMGMFRPPSLKNIAVRAPFMHDGRFSSLTQVIDHYSTGIQSHPNLGASLKDKNGKPRRFNFSPKDKAALIAFLKTLTDETLLNDPKFANPFD